MPENEENDEKKNNGYVIDDKDKDILLELVRDGTATYEELRDRTLIPKTTVFKRVATLRDEKILENLKIHKDVFKFNNVISLMAISGEYDLIALVVGKSADEILLWAMRRLRKTPGIERTHTSFIATQKTDISKVLQVPDDLFGDNNRISLS